MKLVKLEVANWRGLQKQAIEFDSGITVIGGPNECGKTSLRDALRAALLLPTGMRGEKKAIEAHRPWDTRLFPTVKLELIIGGDKCVIEKEFLRSKDWATLKVNGKLVAQDESVQPKLLELLGTSAEWIDTLWSVQGDSRWDYSTPESVKGRLAAAAKDTVMPQVSELERLIDEDYQKFWTAKRSQPTQKLQDIRNATTEMETRVSQIQSLISEANLQSADIARGASHLETMKTDLKNVELQFKTGQNSLGQWETYLRSELQTAEVVKLVAQSEQWLKFWIESSKNLPILVAQNVEWTMLTESLKAEIALEPSRQKIDSLHIRQQYLQLSVASDKYMQVIEIKVPTALELERLTKTCRDLTEIKARLSVGATRAKFLAEKALDVVLTVDNQSAQQMSLPAATENEWTAEANFEVHLPGIARLKVESGNPSIKDDMRKRREIEQEVEQSFSIWKVSTIEELQERYTRKELAITQVKKVDSADLKRAFDLLGEPELGLSSLSIEDRERLGTQISEEIAAAELEFKAAQEKHRAKSDEYVRFMEKNPLHEVDSQLRILREKLVDSPFAIEPDFAVPDSPTPSWFETLVRLISTWQLELKNRTDRAEALQCKLVKPEGEAITAAKLEELERAVGILREKINLGEAAVNKAIGLVEGQGDLYERLVKAQEDLAKAEAIAQRENINAMAVKELHQAFDDARNKLQKDVVAPLADSVTKSFSALTSGFYDHVIFDASLKMSGLATQSIDNVPLEDISFGTREQLLLLTRLCLAELLSESGLRQVVIMDDNLVHTDKKRMEFVCELLEDKAKLVQVVIFTCHPERYASVKNCRELLLA